MEQKDIKDGNIAEKETLPIIEAFFGEKLHKNTFRYAVIDFENKSKLVELKNRNVKKNKYDTTMIGSNKIKYASNSNKESYFFFKFTDALCYYKLNKNDEFYESIGGRCDRGKPEYKQYIYIDIKLLIEIPSKIDDDDKTFNDTDSHDSDY